MIYEKKKKEGHLGTSNHTYLGFNWQKHLITTHDDVDANVKCVFSHNYQLIVSALYTICDIL